MRISHCSTIVVVTIFYLKPMDIASIKSHGKFYSRNIRDYYLKAPKKISFTKFHVKNYEKLYKLLFNAHLIPKTYHKYLLKLMNAFHFY